MYLQGMTSENWQDMRMHCDRQLILLQNEITRQTPELSNTSGAAG